MVLLSIQNICNTEGYKLIAACMFKPFHSGYLQTGTLVNSEDPDEMRSKVNNLKFCQNDLYKQFSGCYSDKHFVNSSPEKQHFI